MNNKQFMKSLYRMIWGWKHKKWLDDEGKNRPNKYMVSEALRLAFKAQGLSNEDLKRVTDEIHYPYRKIQPLPLQGEVEPDKHEDEQDKAVLHEGRGDDAENQG